MVHVDEMVSRYDLCLLVVDLVVDISAVEPDQGTATVAPFHCLFVIDCLDSAGKDAVDVVAPVLVVVVVMIFVDVVVDE